MSCPAEIKTALLSHPHPIAAEHSAGTRCDFSWEIWIDRLFPLLMVAVLFVYCALMSAKKEIWVDEAYSYSLVADASFSHALSSLYQAADGGMPLYYLLANPWAHIFGTDLLTLRLFTSLSIALGMLVLWRLLRARYSSPVAAIAILAVGLNSSLLLNQDTELRYYGIFFLCASLVLLVHSRMGSAPSVRLLVSAWAAHCFLVYSHPFGVLYSACALLGMAVAGRKDSRWKLSFLLASSWLTLLPWLPAIRRVQEFGNPHNWMGPPTMEVVLEGYSKSLPCALLALLIIAGISVLATAKPTEEPEPERSDATLLAQSLAFGLLPLAIGIASWFSTPVFVDRYFLPSVLGMVVLFAHGVDSILRRVKSTLLLQATTTTLLVALLAMPILCAANAPKVESYQVLVKSLGTSVPVLVENANQYLALDYYGDPRIRPYFYILDWKSALRSPALHATVQARIMTRVRGAHYHDDRILETRDALCRFNEFVLVHDGGIAWFDDHVRNNPAFEKVQVGTIPSVIGVGVPTTAWLITRTGVPEECSAGASAEIAVHE